MQGLPMRLAGSFADPAKPYLSMTRIKYVHIW